MKVRPKRLKKFFHIMFIFLTSLGLDGLRYTWENCETARIFLPNFGTGILVIVKSVYSITTWNDFVSSFQLAQAVAGGVL